jgi:ferredoxin-NADP reductase/ferredoxin
MRTYKVTVAPGGQVFEVGQGERILAAARRAGVWLPFECGWGSCGTCKVILVEGDVELLFAGCPAVNERDARRRRIVTCQTTPTSDIVIKANWIERGPRSERPTNDYRARLVRVDMLGPQLRRFTFALDRVTSYREGQYAILDLGEGVRRCYSMSGLAGLPSLEFIAKRYENRIGGQRLFALPVGSEIAIELPYGDMWIRDGDRPVVLIAGGTGISAILALAQKLAHFGERRPVRAFYGAASVAELVCWQDLRSLVEAMPNGRLYGAVVNSAPEWQGPVGLVTDLLASHQSEVADAEVYLAGPPPMVDAVLDQLRQCAVPLDRIHYDRFG